MSFYELNAEGTGYLYLRFGKTPPAESHFHSAIELLFCADGEVELTVGGEKRKITKGMGCFIDSYVVHSMPSSSAILYAVVGDRQFFEPTFQTFHGKIPPVFFSFENTEFLAFLQSIYNQNNGNGGSRYETKCGIVRLLMGELSKTVPFCSRQTNRQTELVATLLSYAAKHIGEDLSLAALSKNFGYSREYLSRTLHFHLGEHWNRYVGRLRAKAAKELLLSSPDLSVLEIAFQCGFDSPNTFYRAYRREFGVSPREQTKK